MKIALTGNICSGKSYLANLLAKKYNLEIYSFASKIKEIAVDLFKMENKDRKLLQNIADKMKEIDKDIWIKYVLADIGEKKNVIIDDLRFENELNYLRQNGFIIIRLKVPEEERVSRIKKLYPDNYKQHIEGSKHNSELNVNNLNVDLEINSDLEALNNIEKFLFNLRNLQQSTLVARQQKKS